MTKALIDFNGSGIFDLDEAFFDSSLKESVIKCINAQKSTASRQRKAFASREDALALVSTEALDRVKSSAGDVHGIASDRSISNVISFGAAHISASIINEAVTALRRGVDQEIGRRLKEIFSTNENLAVVSSGHFWYPPGSYMGWHTNSKVPGWRIYINYCEQQDRSFFRYQDRLTSEVVTLNDREWNIRVFRVTSDDLFWHCVYSDTNRFSLGYLVREDVDPNSWRRRAKRMWRKFSSEK